MRLHTACIVMHGIANASLRPSLYVVTRALWQNERNLCPRSYTLWKNVYPGFPTWRVVGGGRPLPEQIY